MTPDGSWPTIRPGATGYSPRQMCESVPQMVVVVILTIASVGPQRGTGTSSMWMSRTSLKTAARMVSGMGPPPAGVRAGHPILTPAGGGGKGAVRADPARGPRGRRHGHEPSGGGAPEPAVRPQRAEARLPAAPVDLADHPR